MARQYSYPAADHYQRSKVPQRGIIRSFKAKYRSQLNFVLTYTEEERPVKVDLGKTVTMVRHALDGLTKHCVRNSGRHTQVVPADGEFEPIQSLQDAAVMVKLRSLKIKILEAHNVDVDAYVDIDAILPTQEQMTDVAFCQLVTDSQGNETKVGEDENELPPPVKTSAANWMCRNLVRYFEGRSEDAAAVWKI